MAENPERNEGTETKVPQNELATADSLDSLKALLEEEKAATAAKDTRIAELEAQVAEFSGILENKTADLEAATTELANTKEARGQAVAKYLGMAKALNPTIPEGIIAGETIEEIEQSVEKGKAIVAAVKKAIQAEAAATKVPAGAPTRGEISLEGLSPREKIAAGLRPK